ncbi:MAG: hypothetical protein FJ206_16970 [Gemmatimonadetes bacterium]|nr:hypothetical protein [Gemmatimonadota bacterium]
MIRRKNMCSSTWASWMRPRLPPGAETCRSAAPSANRLSDILHACQAREFGWTILTRHAGWRVAVAPAG